MREIADMLAREGLTARRLADTARRLGRARVALESATDELLGQAVREVEGGAALLDPRLLCEAPEEIALRALSRTVMTIGGAEFPPRLQRLENLYDALTSTDGLEKGRTLGGCRFLPRRDGVLIVREPAAALRANPLSLGPGETRVWDNRFLVALGDDETGSEFTVRALGRDGLSSVRDQTGVCHVPPAARTALPSLWRAGQLVAVPDLGVGDPGAPEFRTNFVGFGANVPSRDTAV